jgi:hypothetical protein
MNLRAPLDFLKSPQWCANGVHFLLGYAVLLTTAWWTSDKLTIFAVALFLYAFVLVKEYAIDLRFESGETIASSSEDALGYFAGSIVAWVMILVR